MRVLLFLGVVVLFTLAFADPKECHPRHHKGGHHKEWKLYYKKHYQHYESLPGYKIAPYNTKFAFDLYRQVARDRLSENIVFSPISISTAFAFLSLGAKDQTRSQIIEGLGFNTSEISEQEIHESFHQLLDLLNDVDRELQLSSGNALFISKEHKILQMFLDEAKRLYQSEAFSTDFRNTEEAKNQINSYVEKNTHGKISKLLDSIDEDAILVLINYIYFRAKWEIPFNDKNTEEGDFHVNENSTVKVSFMTKVEMYAAAFADDATLVSIPYEGFADIVFILPKEGKLSEVEQNFNLELVLKWMRLMHKMWVRLFLPKFSVSGTVDLKETLRKLGIVDVFSDNADLSGITGETNAMVTKALHKAVLTVNEKGTEAGASTAVELEPRMFATSVIFDRPFMFFLYDYKAQCVLFTGRIFTPQN